MHSHHIPNSLEVVRDQEGRYAIRNDRDINYGLTRMISENDSVTVIFLIEDTLVAVTGKHYEIKNRSGYLDGECIDDIKLNDPRICEKKPFKPGNDIVLPKMPDWIKEQMYRSIKQKPSDAKVDGEAQTANLSKIK